MKRKRSRKKRNNSETVHLALFSLECDFVLSIHSQEDAQFDLLLTMFLKIFGVEFNENQKTAQLGLLEKDAEMEMRMASAVMHLGKKVPEINGLQAELKKVKIGEKFFLSPRQLSRTEKLDIWYHLRLLSQYSDVAIIEEKLQEYRIASANNPLISDYKVYTQDRKLVFVSDRSDLQCRFCGRTLADGAKFSNHAHSIPEALGNKEFQCGDECNDCNRDFGKEYEQELNRFLGFWRAYCGIPKKKGGIPKIKYKENQSIELVNNTFVLNHSAEDIKSFFSEGHELEEIQEFRFLNIYKALVKIAISSIEDKSTMEKFATSIEWLLDFKAEKFEIEELPWVGLYLNYANVAEKPMLILYELKDDYSPDYPGLVATLHFSFVNLWFIIPFSMNFKEFVNFEDSNKLAAKVWNIQKASFFHMEKYEPAQFKTKIKLRR